MENCFSCAMPLTDETKSKNTLYCSHCADETGNLKSRGEIQAGIAYWFRMIQPDLAEDVAMKRADYYLMAMPQWADA